MQAEMYRIGSIGQGFVAIMAHPSLEADAPASIVNIARLGIQQVVSLLEPSEARNLGLTLNDLGQQIRQACKAARRRAKKCDPGVFGKKG